jgi:hypothetical protein
VVFEETVVDMFSADLSVAKLIPAHSTIFISSPHSHGWHAPTRTAPSYGTWRSRTALGPRPIRANAMECDSRRDTHCSARRRERRDRGLRRTARGVLFASVLRQRFKVDSWPCHASSHLVTGTSVHQFSPC